MADDDDTPTSVLQREVRQRYIRLLEAEGLRQVPRGKMLFQCIN